MTRIDATVSGDSGAAGDGGRRRREQIERKRQPQLPVVQDHFGVLDGARQQRAQPGDDPDAAEGDGGRSPDRDVVKIDGDPRKDRR